MNWTLYNVGLLSIFIGFLLYFLGARGKGQVGVRGVRIIGSPSFVLIALGIVIMAAASWF